VSSEFKAQNKAIIPTSKVGLKIVFFIKFYIKKKLVRLYMSHTSFDEGAAAVSTRCRREPSKNPESPRGNSTPTSIIRYFYYLVNIGAKAIFMRVITSSIGVEVVSKITLNTSSGAKSVIP
jgi:hypothetical protein